MDTLVDILMNLMGFMWVWCRSEEFGRNVIGVLFLERIMCVKYMVYERGREEGDIQNG